MQLLDKIESVYKLTRPQVAAFNKLGVFTAKDALLFFPFRFLDFSRTVLTKDIIPGENVSLKVKIKSIQKRFSFRARINLAEAVASDQSGSIKIVWFNQGYIADILKPGDEIYLAGQPETYKNVLQLTNPVYEKVLNENSIHTSRLVPVYHLTANLYQKTIRNLIFNCLPLAEKLSDSLPKEIEKSQQLMDFSSALKQLHFPESSEQLSHAQKRLDFAEIFENQILAQRQKLTNQKIGSHKIAFDQKLIKQFVSTLPFQLTTEQKKSAWEILQDMEKPEPMNRLLEGDVGSGKTPVSFIAALQAMQKNFQVALLCPTEVLAFQHHQSAMKYLSDKKLFLNCRSVLFTQNFHLIDRKEKTKKELLQKLSDGMPGLYIGTHALLQQNVKFKKLALVIIDEQHRFGVSQRSQLVRGLSPIPHLLSMSATPIPRTLKLALTGELDISQITQKPAERKPIVTKLVSEDNRQKAYEFIAKEIQKGRQAFVVTPLVEESESADIKSAKKEAENLEKIFSGLMHIPPSSPLTLRGENGSSPLAQADKPNASPLLQENTSDFSPPAQVNTPHFSASLQENTPHLSPPLQGGVRGGLNSPLPPAGEFQKGGKIKIGLLHGKMKSSEKEKVMKDFLENKIQILVSTSVVEVGVDVPNASVMLIEGAERFGLSQLHQFRGRVGRSAHQSYCFLFASENSIFPSPGVGRASRPSQRAGRERSNESLDRLHSFTKTQNGFELAEFDLKQRGFGRLFGQEQSGWDFKYFNPEYIALIPKAREEAKKLLANDLNLSDYPQLSEKLLGQQVHFE